jgi:hypothetical protein
MSASPVNDQTRAQATEVLRKHAKELGIEDKFNEALNMPAQELLNIYNSEILQGQYGITIPVEELPTVNSIEELNAFMAKFNDLPVPGTVPQSELTGALEQLKAKLAGGGVAGLSAGGGLKGKFAGGASKLKKN